MTEDQLLENLLEFDVDEIKSGEGFFSIYCNPKSIEPIKEKLLKMGFKIENADLEWVAKNTTDVSNDNVYDFLTELEDHDDVQNVYSNLA